MGCSSELSWLEGCLSLLLPLPGIPEPQIPAAPAAMQVGCRHFKPDCATSSGACPADRRASCQVRQEQLSQKLSSRIHIEVPSDGTTSF